MEKITTHISDAQARLIGKFRDKPKFLGMIASFVQQIQELENSTDDVLNKRLVATATGQQLDGLGEIVGVERKGLDDEKYRTRIIGQIGVNTSQGTPENLIAIFNILTDSENAYYTPYYPAEVMIQGDGVPFTENEVLVDGDMEAEDTSAWTIENDATLTKETIDDEHYLKIAYNGTPDVGASQNVLTVGGWYWLNGKVRTQNASGERPIILNGTATLLELYAFNDWYEFDVIFKATDSKIVLGSEFTSANWVGYNNCTLRRMKIDNVEDVFTICQSVLPAGVLLMGVGFYGIIPDTEVNKMFSFSDDPEGYGFSDINDPDSGGKFASLYNID